MFNDHLAANISAIYVIVLTYQLFCIKGEHSHLYSALYPSFLFFFLIQYFYLLMSFLSLSTSLTADWYSICIKRKIWLSGRQRKTTHSEVEYKLIVINNFNISVIFKTLYKLSHSYSELFIGIFS